MHSCSCANCFFRKILIHVQVRGVDYQPGGSSGYTGATDPLTDIDSLARDIYLFQKLGINTIRV